MASRAMAQAEELAFLRDTSEQIERVRGDARAEIEAVERRCAGAIAAANKRALAAEEATTDLMRHFDTVGKLSAASDLRLWSDRRSVSEPAV